MSGEDFRMALAQERHDAEVEDRNLDQEEAELVEDLWLQDWAASAHRPSSDCRDGKHTACYGGGWDLSADGPISCPCGCHGGAS